MATVTLVPTAASIVGFQPNTVGGIGILGDGNNNTYYTTDEDALDNKYMIHMSFSNSLVYNDGIATINSIALHIGGKVLMVASPSITTNLNCLNRGDTLTIQPETQTFLSGGINTVFTFLSPYLSSDRFTSGNIDSLDFDLVVSLGGLLLISEIYVIVDYSLASAGRIEIDGGSVELTEGHISL